jgi:hypothetical protein
MAAAARSTCSIVTAFMARRLHTMPTARGVWRAPDLHLLMCLGVTPNSLARWCWARPSAASVAAINRSLVSAWQAMVL